MHKEADKTVDYIYMTLTWVVNVRINTPLQLLSGQLAFNHKHERDLPQKYI